MDFKSKHVLDFLNEGNKVKVTIRFRGRELAHTELGLVVLKQVLDRLNNEYVLEKPPLMEGRFMSMMLGPKVKIPKAGPAPEEAQDTAKEATKEGN